MIEAGHGEKILVSDIQMNSREKQFREGQVQHYRQTRPRSVAIEPTQAEKIRQRSLDLQREQQEREDEKFRQMQQRQATALRGIEERREQIMESF